MRFDAIVVPRGAEARAVEHGWNAPRPPLLMVPAGAAAGDSTTDGPSIATALVLGLCGALDPALRVGMPVVYREIADGSLTIDLDRELVARCARRLGRTAVRAASVATVVGSAAEKHALRQATGAAAIDMEAAAVARALQARGVRVAMVRVVSDDAQSELPDLRDVYDAGGALRPFTLGWALIRSPLRGARFVAGALTALRALKRTAAQLSTDAR